MPDIDVNRVLKLEHDYNAAKQEVIKELLQLRKTTDEQLAQLGHVQDPRRSGKAKKACSKCGATDHDARAHRGSSKAKTSVVRDISSSPPPG